jgi:hypothetical protein
MATRKRPAPSKSRSGPSVPEDERLSIAIKLRLAPDVAARLRAIAGPRGVSAWVAARVAETA